MMCHRCDGRLALVPVAEGDEKASLCIGCATEWNEERSDEKRPLPDAFSRFLKGDDL